MAAIKATNRIMHILNNQKFLRDHPLGYILNVQSTVGSSTRKSESQVAMTECIPIEQ